MKRQLIIAAMVIALAGCGKKEEKPAEEATATTEEAAAEQSAPEKKAASFGDAVDGLERKAGFFDLYIKSDEGKILASLPAPDDNGVSLRFIYATGLTAGLGSNPIGLDRGAFDSGVIVAFRRVGNKIIAEQENWKYRAQRRQSARETGRA